METTTLISTEGDRLTIHFDWYHAHFDGWGNRTLADAFTDAFRFLDNIFCEAFVVGITFREGRWTRSCIFTPDDLAAIPPGTVTYIRSWRGTFDAVYRI